MKVVFVFYQASPLQRARLATCARHMDVTLIEVVRKSQHYAWGADVANSDVETVSLFEEASSASDEYRAVQDALQAQTPDVVFAMGYGRRFARAVSSYALRNGIPAVLISDSTALEAKRGIFARLLKKAIVGGHHGAFVAGSAQARQIKTLGMPGDRVVTGYDVVDNAAIAERVDTIRSASTEGSAQEPPYFLCVSRLVWQKNLPTLIDAFSAFKNRSPDAPDRLKIAGYGPLKEELQAKIDALGLTNDVVLLGGVSYDEMPLQYSGATALVLASRSEPWGLVVNEAMAAGLPVAISTACGCQEDLVAVGRNGYLFDTDDIQAIAECLHNLASDREASRAMGAQSRVMIADWSLERFAQSVLAIATHSQSVKLSTFAKWKARLALAILQMRADRVRGFER